MRISKTLILLAFVAAIALSVLYGRYREGFTSSRSISNSSNRTEGFVDAGTGVAIGLAVVGVVLMAFFFLGVKPEKRLLSPL